MTQHEMNRILLVEDDDDFRETLTLALQAEAYHVDACSSGLEAIEKAHTESFDLVISDIRMAGMSGLDTLERLQQEQPTVATLVMTGFSAEAETVRAVKLGVGDFLRKPFGLDEFLQAVANQLSLHKARQVRRLREQNARRVAVWALESWLGSHAENSPSLLNGRLARETALEMGLAADLAVQPQIALLVEACRGSVPGGIDEAGLPEDLISIVDGLRIDGEISGEPALVARIARAASQPLAPDEEQSAIGLAWQRACRRSPSLRVGTYGGEPEGGSAIMARRRRSLLSLARSQEQGGQGAEAALSYRNLLDKQQSDRVAVEANLGLMRLSVNEGEACRAYATEAVTLSVQVNPLLCGLACLEAGLHLARAGFRPESQTLFERSRRLAHEVAQPALEAKAVLALAGSRGAKPSPELDQALNRLLEVHERYELIDGAWWILPCLLRMQSTQPNPLQERLLSLLGRDSPVALNRLLQANRLEPGSRLCAVAALVGSSHPAALEGLRLLSVDPQPEVRRAAEVALGGGAARLVPPTVRIYTLGTFEVYRGEERLPETAFNSWRQRFLLARLAGADMPIPVERIIDEFWQGYDIETGRVGLNSAVYYLRRALRPTEWPETLDYISRVSTGIQLTPNLPVWHDLKELLEVPSPETAGEVSEETLGAWQRAVQLYRGPYLDQCYMDWASAQRQRAETLVLGMLRKLVAIFAKQGRGAEILDYAARLLEMDACCQDAHLALMRAHLQANRPEAALRQFEVCKRVLDKELKMEPSIAILEARQRALLNID